MSMWMPGLTFLRRNVNPKQFFFSPHIYKGLWQDSIKNFCFLISFNRWTLYWTLEFSKWQHESSEASFAPLSSCRVNWLHIWSLIFRLIETGSFFMPFLVRNIHSQFSKPVTSLVLTLGCWSLSQLTSGKGRVRHK